MHMRCIIITVIHPQNFLSVAFWASPTLWGEPGNWGGCKANTEPWSPVFPFLLVVQSPSHLWLFATPWTAARQASLSFTSSQSLQKLMSIESVMPSNHLILCRPLLLLPSIFPSIRVFSNEFALPRDPPVKYKEKI